MARLPRSLNGDGLAHDYARAIRREPLFVSPRDAYSLLWRAAEAFERFDVECRGYCLMPTHYHFLLWGKQVDRSNALHRLNGGYAQWFNRQYGFRGRLFGDRFGERPIADEDHLLEVIRYVVLNPLRAGLCGHPRDWRWSSYAATAGTKPRPHFLRLHWMEEVMSPEVFVAHVDELVPEALLAA